MCKIELAFQNKHLISLGLSAFSNLLNIAPRGETDSRRVLNELLLNTESGSDSANLAKDFTAVGMDIQNAMKAYDEGTYSKTV